MNCGREFRCWQGWRKMMSETRYKLHPLSAFLNFIKGLKDLIVPFIVIFGVNLFQEGGISGMFTQGWEGLIPFFIGIVVVLFTLVAGIIKWKRFVYWFEEGELRIEYGLFVKKKRYIPFDRIQSLDYTEGVFHRLLGLVKVKVETAGSGKAGESEAVLTAVLREDADRIAQKMEEAKRVFHKKVESDEEELAIPVELQEKKEARVLYRMTLKELIILATTSSGIGVVLSAVAVFLSQFSDILPFEAVYEEVILFLRFGYLIVALVIFTVLTIAWIISVFLTIFANYQFTIQADEDNIYITRGLLEKKKISVPFKRVQGIKITQNPLREWFGYATVTVESAGGSLGDKEEKIRLFPLAKKSVMLPVLSELFPETEWEPELTGAPKRSARFYYRLDFIWGIPLIAAMSYLFYPYGLASLLMIPIIILLGLWQHRTVGYALSGRQLTMRFRGFSKHSFYLMKKRVQVVDVTQSYFQRRKQLATIEATIKSGMLGASARILHMDISDAERIMSWYKPTNRPLPEKNKSQPDMFSG